MRIRRAWLKFAATHPARDVVLDVFFCTDEARVLCALEARVPVPGGTILGRDAALPEAFGRRCCRHLLEPNSLDVVPSDGEILCTATRIA